jgi:hypothetical protein
MPCSDGLSGGYYNTEVRYVTDPNDKRRLDKLTRLLCAICGAADAAGQPQLLDEETRIWYENHKAIDQALEEIESADSETAKAAVQSKLIKLLEEGAKL